ncbi:MAG: hypothetical protein EOP11_10565 [Proteobacteria bacterium]|nr:MAG: hypothetical protein EOP11_10565 [Pseudomonadota bacterium]
MTSLHLLHALNQNPGISFYALAKLARMDTSNCRKLALELAGLGLLRVKIKAGDSRRAAQLYANATEIRVMLTAEVSLSSARLKALGKHRGG